MKSLLLLSFSEFYLREEILYLELFQNSQFQPLLLFHVSAEVATLATTAKSSVSVQLPSDDQESEVRELHSPVSLQHSSNSTLSLLLCCYSKPNKVYNLNESSPGKRKDENHHQEHVDESFFPYKKSAESPKLPASRKCKLLRSFQPFIGLEETLLKHLSFSVESVTDSIMMNSLYLICVSTEDGLVSRYEILQGNETIDSGGSTRTKTNENYRSFDVILYDDYGVVMERQTHADRTGIITLPYALLIEYLEWVKFCHLLNLLPIAVP
jgi:hypothetical protein